MSPRELWAQRLEPLLQDDIWLLTAAASCYEASATLHTLLAERRLPADLAPVMRQVALRLFSCGDELRAADRPTAKLLDRVLFRLHDPVRAARFALVETGGEARQQLERLAELLDTLQTELRGVRHGLALVGGEA